MADTGALRDAFLGGDPLIGDAALDRLLAAGDAGEEALFSGALTMASMQVRRRWLRYVASRPATVGPRLLARVKRLCEFHDHYAAADLFSGLPAGDPVHRQINESLHAEFANGTPSIHSAEDYWRVAAQIAAVGAGSDSAWGVFRLVEGDDYAWEKLRTHAFRAACCVAARLGEAHIALLARFVTRRVDASDDIDLAELWLQSYHTFPLWRAGSLVDRIFSDWSAHEDRRLRYFGAMILHGLAFRRAQGPLLRWIRIESDKEVRATLVNALSVCGTSGAADALLELDARGMATREAIAGGAALATQRGAVIESLERVADGEDTAAAEALVALARIGVASRGLPAALFSGNDYRRLNAALAYGLLEDRSRTDDLLALQEESAGPMESVYVAAALAMLNPGLATTGLHQQLVRSAEQGADAGNLIRLKPALQRAIVTAFERGGAGAERMLAAWKAELGPLQAPPWTATPVSGAAEVSILPAVAPAGKRASVHRQVPERFIVAFSFAGAQRQHVTAVAAALEGQLGRSLVFLDDWFQAYVAGHDADLLLQEIYGKRSDLIVMCIAAEYDDRPWTIVEHRALRALVWGAKPGSQQALRLLPLRFGDGDVRGVPSNTIAPDVRKLATDDVVALILARLQLLN